MSSPSHFRIRTRTSGGTEPAVPMLSQLIDLPTGQLLSSTLISPESYPGELASYESHYCFDQAHKRVKGQYREGGPLDIVHTIRRVKPVEVHLRCEKSFNHTNDGVCYPIFAGVPAGYSVNGLGGFTDRELEVLGTTGWERFRPGRPVVQGLSSLVELRELPRMLKARLSDFRGLSGKGKAYLEYQFGWKSLLRDLQSMYKLYRDIDRRLDAIRKHNGKWSMRKGIVLQDITSEPYESINSYWGFRPSVFGDTISSWSVRGIARKEQTVWFEGRFRYYIPEKEMASKHWKRDTIRKMYGLTLTPDHAWELIPWSWLIDYFANVGDLFKNLSGGYVDAVAKYAYVMATTRHTVSQHSSMVSRQGNVLTGTIESDLTIKQRRAASPFGFGMDVGSLSDFQMMILGALGISKLR